MQDRWRADKRFTASRVRCSALHMKRSLGISDPGTLSCERILCISPAIEIWVLLDSEVLRRLSNFTRTLNLTLSRDLCISRLRADGGQVTLAITERRWPHTPPNVKTF